MNWHIQSFPLTPRLMPKVTPTLKSDAVFHRLGYVTPIVVSLLLYEETNFILWICWTVEWSLLIVNNDWPTFSCTATMLCSWKFVTNDSDWNGTLLIRDVMWRGGHESVHTDCFRFCLLTINIVTNSCVTLLTIQRSFLLKITLDGIQNETEAT